MFDLSDGRHVSELSGPTKGVTSLGLRHGYIAATCEDFATYIYTKVDAFVSSTSKYIMYAVFKDCSETTGSISKQNEKLISKCLIPSLVLYSGWHQ